MRPVEEDVRLVREIRSAIGPTARAAAGREHGLARRDGTRALAALEPYGIANVEEPVASFSDLAALRASTRDPVLRAHTGRRACGRARRPGHDRASASARAAGSPARGGSSPPARRRGVGFWFYSGDLGIATAAYLHLAAATPYLDRPSQSLLRWTTDDVIQGGPFSPERGVVAVPSGPGLGVELDETALARCVERFSRLGAYDYYGGPSLPRY